MAERLLEDFAEIASDWFWEMDADLRFVYFSERLAAVAGVDPQKEIGRSRIEIAANATDPAFWEPHLDELRARRPFRDFVYPYRHKDGRIRWFKISGQPHHDAGGRFLGYRGVGTDITAQRESQDRLAEALEGLREANGRAERRSLQFDTALNNMAQGLAMFDSELRLTVCNRRYPEILNLPPELARPGMSLREIIEQGVAAGRHGDRTADEVYAERTAIFGKGEPTTLRTPFSDGRIIETTYRPMADGGWVATYDDVTSRELQLRKLEHQEEALRVQNLRFDAALSNMPNGLCMFDGAKRLVLCNAAYARMYDLPAALTQSGTPLDQILAFRRSMENAPLDAVMYVDQQVALALKGTTTSFRVELQDGRTIQISYNPIEGGGYVATHEDVTDAIRAEAKIAHLARHDALTGLPNRTVLRERMEEGLARVRRGETLTVLCLDLDRFKAVNDTLGHGLGDAVLKAVTRRLLACVREADTVARLGGDEFAVLQLGAGKPEDASALARRIIGALSDPYDLDGHHIEIGASVGITFAPGDASDPDTLLKHADLALYRAKADGRGTYHFFEPAMHARLQFRRELEIDLRRAVAANEFELHYQPLVDVATGKAVAFEALLRWNRPGRGPVSPAEFIPVAEETGFIVPLGEWVLREACREASTWPSDIKVAVNLSPVQFKARTLLSTVVSALAASGLPASRLEVEITESVLLHDGEQTTAILRQLRDLGVQIALDDFGTGYSSLSYLRLFPFDKIKIDRSFVRELADKPDCLAIVKALSGLAGNLHMTTTAEGVETEAQLQQVREQGCTEAQGYLFSRPMPASAVPELLARLGHGMTRAA